MTTRKPSRFVFWGLALLLVAAGAALWAWQNFSFLPEPPVGPVLAMPGSPEQRVQPYRGPHPRFKPRPIDKFDYPILPGEVGPVRTLFTPVNRYPFLCGKNRVHGKDGQPLVDNHAGLGMPVFAVNESGERTDKVVGYSKDCLHPTQVRYYYRQRGTDDFLPLDELPKQRGRGDIARIVVNGHIRDFVVRLETGTINRFFYAIAVLSGNPHGGPEPDSRAWNRRLIYQFRGGVGIGRRQGTLKAKDVLERRAPQLAQGYAVVYSTANQTRNHYNIWLAEDTAWRVKRQFVALYGEPLYTVGVGGSGGAIQQYLLAQNSPDLLDGAIALYSYPDMVTQTNYVFDCELLEYYFDVLDGQNPLWKEWRNRTLIEGMNAKSGAENQFRDLIQLAGLLSGNIPEWETGSSECVNGWRGLTPLVNNPAFVHFRKGFARRVRDDVHWSYWEDLKHFYGVNAHGYANRTWDNVGVQYGLESLRDGRLSVEDFLRLNAHVGGWKPSHKMQPEKFWVLNDESLMPVNLSVWSHHNMLLSEDGGRSPAPRSHGSVAAIRAAYQSGQVFLGYADIPIIDLRHYLDDELNMHHATGSFSARARMIRARGHAGNQIMWMTKKPHDPTDEAFQAMDRWLANQLTNPERGVSANRPPNLTDQCFDGEGRVIAAGSGVWDGHWNGRPPGACMRAYPRYKTSREVAGESVAGDTFKCRLQSVERAIERGVYGDVDMRPYSSRLSEIFPEGVCDYTRPGVGRPDINWQASVQDE